jgi:deazaflavin-dependent oxidoreductase (nitroreductase family)
MFAWQKGGNTMRSQASVPERTSPVLTWLIIVLSALLIVPLGFSLLIIAFMIAIRKLGMVRDRVRQFNKNVLNPVVLPQAGRRLRFYAIVHHVGRRSGRSYSTPVVAEPTADGFVIMLPYGKQDDWCRNVMAAGGGTLFWRGQEYAVGEPELIGGETALEMVPSSKRFALRMLRIPQSLKVKTLTQVPEPGKVGEDLMSKPS